MYRDFLSDSDSSVPCCFQSLGFATSRPASSTAFTRRFDSRPRALSFALYLRRAPVSTECGSPRLVSTASPRRRGRGVAATRLWIHSAAVTRARLLLQWRSIRRIYYFYNQYLCTCENNGRLGSNVRGRPPSNATKISPNGRRLSEFRARQTEPATSSMVYDKKRLRGRGVDAAASRIVRTAATPRPRAGATLRP